MDVVAMGRYRKGKLFGRLSKADKEIAKTALERVDLWEYRNRRISDLSGGQQQRTFIARALAQQADLYLMDEPFVGIDAASEGAILDLLREMRNSGKTVVLVHHDLHTALEFFDWVILLNTRLVAAGPMEEVLTEENLRTAYGGKLNVLSRVVDLIRSKEYPVREKDMRE
jgi:manganese/zinc/iron transport system ATP- binding protein